MDSVYIVMPAYNEEANIEKVITSWYPVLRNKSEDSKIIVADSGSTDHTHSILKELKKKYKQLELLENTKKEHGPKVIALYKNAIEKGVDFVFQTDSDGQTNPDEFEAFWELRKEYDFIIGNRKQREDGIQRKVVERVVCLLLRIYYHVRIPDANAPFRLLRTDILKKYISLISPDYFLPNVILSAFLVYNSERVCF